MEENKDEKLIFILKIILLIVAYSFIAIFGFFFILIRNVDALDLNYSQCVAEGGWQTSACNVSTDKRVTGNYVNVVTTYPSGQANKTYQFSLYYDLYFIDQNNLDGEYVRTPKVNIYINGTKVNVTTNTTIQNYRSWCDSGQVGCWRIRTFLTTFQWTGNPSSASVTWNIVSQTGNSGTGWAQDPSDASHSIGPYFTFGQSLASYSDDTQQAIENMNGTMQQGFSGINENNNRLTESINTTTTNKANDIIANQNANNQALQDKIQEQYEACDNYNLNKNNTDGINGNLLNTGDITGSSASKVTNYMLITKNKTYNLQPGAAWNSSSYCLYDKNKILINCVQYSLNTNFNITPTQDGYIRYTYAYNTTAYKFTGEYCYNRLDKQNQQQAEQNAYLQDSSIDSSSMNGFNVSFDYGGVTGVLTAPLNAINSILSNTCSDLVFTLPFVNKQITLPCLTPIYQTHASGLLSLYQTVITGIVSYWICLNIFKIIKGFSDPQEDRIEVLEL